jgi:hypothetical protein
MIYNPETGSIINPLKTEFLLNRVCVCIQFVPHTKHVCNRKISQLKLFRDIVATYCKNHTKHTNTLCGQSPEFLLRYSKWYMQ